MPRASVHNKRAASGEPKAPMREGRAWRAQRNKLHGMRKSVVGLCAHCRPQVGPATDNHRLDQPVWKCPRSPEQNKKHKNLPT